MMSNGICMPGEEKKMYKKRNPKSQTCKNRKDFLLSFGGPSVLPLSGQGGTPILYKRRAKSSTRPNLHYFEPNQFKETLKANQDLASIIEKVIPEPNVVNYLDQNIVK